MDSPRALERVQTNFKFQENRVEGPRKDSRTKQERFEELDKAAADYNLHTDRCEKAWNTHVWNKWHRREDQES